MSKKTARLGILGGGQLSLMLVEAARELGHETLVYCQSAREPAAQISEFSMGKIDDLATLESFFSRVDIVAYESDFLPFEKLRKLSESAETKLCPSLEVIEAISQKSFQRNLLKKLKIGSPAFEILDANQLGQPFLPALLERLKKGWVLKWSRGGYDGKGVLFGKDSLSLESLDDFVRRGLQHHPQLVIEKKIQFQRELSLVSSYSRDGSWAFFPVVVTEQFEGICKKVFGPARNFGLSEMQEMELRSWAKRIGEELKLFGTFAIEVFDSAEGLLVNEIAPRVHNTGHFSQDEASISQFQNHWKALLGEAITDPKTKDFFGMWNLLGPLNARSQSVAEIVIPQLAQPFVFHWYKKENLQKLRKMGHLNFSARTKEELESTLSRAQSIEEDFWRKL